MEITMTFWTILIISTIILLGIIVYLILKPNDSKVATRPHVAYQDKIDSIYMAIMKSAPRMLARIIILWTLTAIITIVIGARNAERIAAVGADLIQGDYVSALGTLGSFGKGPALEYKNVAFGTNDYLSKKGLDEFSYIGQKKGNGYAVMEEVYSVKHHDPEFPVDDENYNNPIAKIDVDSARNFCLERYGLHDGDLISFEEWEKSQANFLGRNHFRIPNKPEWTRTESEDDNDDYRIIPHGFNAEKYVKENGIDNEENGQYIDGDDSEELLFRCSINWPIE